MLYHLQQSVSRFLNTFSGSYSGVCSIHLTPNLWGHALQCLSADQLLEVSQERHCLSHHSFSKRIWKFRSRSLDKQQSNASRSLPSFFARSVVSVIACSTTLQQFQGCFPSFFLSFPLFPQSLPLILCIVLSLEWIFSVYQTGYIDSRSVKSW